MQEPMRGIRGSPTGTDVLQWPLVGRLLRWRHARTSLQLVLLAAAAAVVLHGLFGPDLAPGNLATVLTWVHYRGLLVIALLAAGNFFCAGCPFVLVRDWGRRLHAPARLWPKRLRGKWIAIVFFAAVLFAYELFDLWALPRGTAYLVLGYFAAALAIDTVFKGATFCKHLCPIGQFNFVASTLSPLELQIREPATCQACRTSDCIAGRRAPEPPFNVVQRGCELGLYLPAKVGNIDCTFCLDCVHACPHDNIAIAMRTPGIELGDTRRRSGIGRLVNRPDIAVLSVLFVFGALVNAFAMVSPVHEVERWLGETLGTTSESVVLGCLFVLGLGVAPLALLGAASGLTRVLAGSSPRTARAVQYRGQTPGGPLPTVQILRGSDTRDSATSLTRVALQYAYGLVPFGFGMWLAHYGFHFLTGALTVVPVTQSAAIDLTGWAALGDPLWRWAGMRPGAVFPIQLGCILLGALGSIAVMHDISRRACADRPVRATVPWAAVVLLLTAAAIWILFQPMEMRGMGLEG
jgi:polyferredoxin